MNSRNWTEDEAKMAFALYFLLDLREFNKSNPDAISLAFTIDRTPAAVSAKLWNISAHDTNHIEAGYSGMRHASKLDHQIWTEYDSRGDKLVAESAQLLTNAVASRGNKLTSFQRISTELDSLPESREKMAIVKRRINQQYFRSTLLTSYGGACCVTGLAVPSLLVASHIKPWACCDPKTERLAGRNGVLLNVLHDRAFDQGHITINTDYRVRISHRIKQSQDQLGWL